MPKKTKKTTSAKIISGMDFLKAIKKNPELFLQKYRGNKLKIRGIVGNYSALIDCLWLNEKPNRIVLIFKPGSLSSQYQIIPKGSKVLVRGTFNFLHYPDSNGLSPSLIDCELLELEQ